MGSPETANEVDVDQLVAKIQELDDVQELDLNNDAVFSAATNDLSGMSEEELQKFLEQGTGISPQEEPQAIISAAATTAVAHC